MRVLFCLVFPGMSRSLQERLLTYKLYSTIQPRIDVKQDESLLGYIFDKLGVYLVHNYRSQKRCATSCPCCTFCSCFCAVFYLPHIMQLYAVCSFLCPASFISHRSSSMEVPCWKAALRSAWTVSGHGKV